MVTNDPVWLPLSEVMTRAMAELSTVKKSAIEDALVLAFLRGQITVRGTGITNVDYEFEAYEIKQEFWNKVQGRHIRWDDNAYIYDDNEHESIEDRVVIEQTDDDPPCHYTYYEVWKNCLEVRLEEFEKWLLFAKRNHKAAFASLQDNQKAKRRRGRKPGDGSYEIIDEPLIEEMRGLIETGKARSANAAAEMLCGKAEGGGSPTSRKERLRKRYIEKYSGNAQG